MGEVFGDRGIDSFYGWSNDPRMCHGTAVSTPTSGSIRWSTFTQFQNREFALADGEYAVTVSIGDAEFGSTHTLNVEGVSFWSEVGLSPGEFLTQTANVTVNDGRLTLDQGNAIEKATRINYIQIVNLPSAPNNSPAQPTILEPVVGRTDINPTDVHMEAVGFSDVDGDATFPATGKSGLSELMPNPFGRRSVSKASSLHTHLGDGIFMGSHAGRTDLLPNTPYELRVRFETPPLRRAHMR